MHDIAQKQIFFLKTTRAGSGSGFGGEISGSRKKGPDPTGSGSATLHFPSVSDNNFEAAYLCSLDLETGRNIKL